LLYLFILSLDTDAVRMSEWSHLFGRFCCEEIYFCPFNSFLIRFPVVSYFLIPIYPLIIIATYSTQFLMLLQLHGHIAPRQSSRYASRDCFKSLIGGFDCIVLATLMTLDNAIAVSCIQFHQLYILQHIISLKVDVKLYRWIWG